MKKNVLIVTFNTQKMTECCIKSINKTTPGCSIYVFDNGNVSPFINTFENVTIIDNTSGQIINFEEILNDNKDRLTTASKDNDYGSLKHCLSIDAAMDIIQDGFILMDSDILIKKDFTSLYDETKIYVGYIEKMPHFTPRVAPFLCYINVRMCKENGIKYFNWEHMLGFRNEGDTKLYDTGCWFYEACKDLPKKEISINQYMVHFRAASWYKEAVEKQNYKKIQPEKWLERNRQYWYIPEEKPNNDNKVQPKEGTKSQKTTPEPPEEERKEPKTIVKRKGPVINLSDLKRYNKKIILRKI